MLNKALSLAKATRHILRARASTSSIFSNPAIPPVIIYQMGKVGSSSVYFSLKAASIVNPVLQVHFLSDELPNYRAFFKAKGVAPPPLHIYLGEALRAKLDQYPDRKVKIISLVRDPVAYTLSDLFQNPEFYLPDSNSGDAASAELGLNLLISRLADPGAIHSIYSWFDRELKSVFGIDVFAVPFPITQGFGVFHGRRAEVLVIRLEDLSEIGPKIISGFLEIPERLTITNKNVRADTPVSNDYQRLKQEIRLSPELVRNIYNNRFVRHFYSDEMIQFFTKRWSGQVAY